MKAVDPSVVHRLFYPGVPALLCSSSARDVSAMPVVSYASVSAEPPLVGIACAPRSFTLKLAVASGEFTLCFLDKSRADALTFLATHSGRAFPDKLAAAGLPHRRGSKVGAPVVSDSAAVVECSVSSHRRLGDHILLVGRVEAASASGDFHGYWRFRRYAPILYTGWQGRFSTYGAASRRT